MSIGASLRRAPSADFSDSIFRTISGVDGALDDGIYLHQGDSVEAVTRNYAPGGVVTGQQFAEMIGDVLLQSTHIDCVSHSDYLDSGKFEAETYSAVSVFRSFDTFVGGAHQPHLFGNFDGNSGSSIFLANHSTQPAPQARLRANAYTAGGNNLPTVNLVDATQWTCAISCISASVMFIRDMTHGFENQVTPLAGARTIDATTMFMGSSRSAAALGTNGIAATAYFPGRYLNLAGRTAVHNFLKANLGRSPINIAI